MPDWSYEEMAQERRREWLEEKVLQPMREEAEALPVPAPTHLDRLPPWTSWLWAGGLVAAGIAVVAVGGSPALASALLIAGALKFAYTVHRVYHRGHQHCRVTGALSGGTIVLGIAWYGILAHEAGPPCDEYEKGTIDYARCMDAEREEGQSWR